MNEEVDYAEMLEIPVSTVNVVKKPMRKRRDVKEAVIDSVNEKVSSESDESEPEREASSLRIYDSLPKKRANPVLIGEFVAAIALCLVIFLTNVFMENSAMNNFVERVFSSQNAADGDARSYQDFKLTGIVNDFSSVPVTTASGGALCFTGEESVYPVCDGSVQSVSETDGLYTVTLSHSSSFGSVITGLSRAYVKVGDEVKWNLPIGYSDGKNEVRVMLYDNDTLLDCYQVDEDNAISWKS